jgi:transcriptional regulator with GAF, ATPase, and Fis domain
MPDREKTYDAILRVMMEATSGENCSLMLKSPETDELVIQAAKGRRDLDLLMGEKPFRKRFYLDGGVATWVLKTGRGVYLSDAGKDPRFVDIGESPFKIGSLMCFPVRDGDHTVGILNLSNADRGAFGDREETAMKIVSNQIAIVLTAASMAQEFHRDRKDSQILKKEGTLSGLNPQSVKGHHLAIPCPEKYKKDEESHLLYESEKMVRVVEIVEQIADTDVTVLIDGESGVGKELVARALHYRSMRRDMPFIKVNCAALPEELLESELFGYEKGAFTGAYRRKPGKFELAHGGTIFLDEVAEISPLLQAKLLQVLQDGEFARLGGKEDIQVSVRVLVATNRNLEQYVKAGRFREDLYYRLNVLNIHVPPLRERREEIPDLVRYLLDRYSRKYDKPVPTLSLEARKLLLSHDWPGNVRELENMIKRLVVLGDETVLKKELILHFPSEPEPPVDRAVQQSPKSASLSLREISRKAALQAEGELIQRTLEQTRWNRKKAAKLLGISYKALLYKIKECGLDHSPAV